MAGSAVATIDWSARARNIGKATFGKTLRKAVGDCGRAGGIEDGPDVFTLAKSQVARD
jgi:hypothetical protein